MGLNPDFWRGRKVLVTGHTGFKGSWLCLWLQELGAAVTGYALTAPTKPSLFAEARVAEGMAHNEADIRDISAFRKALEDAQPEIIFHLAAQALVLDGYADPLGTISTNIIGTANVLEASRHCPSVRGVVVVTSDKCYENKEWIWPYREDEPLGGRDPYSASKACAEILTAAWRHSFMGQQIGVASTRAGNVIGGGDWAANRLVPDALRAWQAGTALLVRNPLAVRPWQHVLEPLTGYLMLAERLHRNDCAKAWNFGPDDTSTATVAELLDKMSALWGHDAKWSADAARHQHEAGQLRLDSSKARLQLGWKPRHDIDNALGLTVSWHKAWMRGEDMRRVSVDQIRDYMN